MQKIDIVKKIASETRTPVIQCEKIVDLFLEEIKKGLKDGEKITLKNFAVFEVKERKERLGRNPSTNEVVLFPSVKSVRCKFSKALKSLICGERENNRNET